MAGGVALNSLMNGKILSNSKFKNIWIQPNATDGGTSMGAALFVANSLLKLNRKYKLSNAFLGPEYSDEFIKGMLDERDIKYTKFKDDNELVKVTSQLLKEENVIGWFQGRMEWGPRALGARSILASPLTEEMKDLINLKVKKREPFRPFAPVVAFEDAPKYFKTDKPLPDSADYMLMVYPIKEHFHNKIPAVKHVDGTGRLQTIKREQMPLYYDVIKEFGKLTGTPILINTSFNIRGEPIVCTPHDAYKCMMGTEIDYLVMGGFLINRVDNSKDIWNSEVNKQD
jgi:carbamoyltransferase